MPDENVPTLLAVGVTERGMADQGEYGMLGVVGPNGERARLALPHHFIDAFVMELLELKTAIQQTRAQAGKDKGPVVTQARRLVGFGTILDRDRTELRLVFDLEGGARNAISIDRESVSHLIADLLKGKEALETSQPPPAN